MITIKIEIFRIFTQKTGRINTGHEIKMNFQLTPESEVEINPDIACSEDPDELSQYWCRLSKA